MRTVTILAIILVARVAMGSAELVKEKAKQQRDLNNQQQGVVPPSRPNPAAPTPTTTPGVVQGGLSPAQQALVDRLQAELTSIGAGTARTGAQLQRVEDDLALLSKGSSKPSKASLAKLASDLAAALKEKPLTLTQMTKLARNINILLNSGFLNATQAQAFVNETQTLLKTAGISPARVEPIGKDLGVIYVEIQKNKPRLYG